MVKERNILTLFNFYKSSNGLKGNLSISSKLIGFFILIIGISLINSIRAYLDYGDVITPFIQILFGMPLLFLIFYGIYYIFQISFEDNSLVTFWNSYLKIGIPIFFGLLIMHFFNLLQFLSNSSAVNYLFAILNSIIVIFILIMFILNVKTYFKTTYPKVLASLLLMFLVNLSLVGLFTLIGFR